MNETSPLGPVERLVRQLTECRTDFDGNLMPDRAEPIGCDCELLRKVTEELNRYREVQETPHGALRVDQNSCKCHPETCCCRQWAIYREDGSKHSTHFSRAAAEEIANALNQRPNTDSIP